MIINIKNIFITILILTPLLIIIILVINPFEQMAETRDKEKILILKMVSEERDIEIPDYVFQNTNGNSKIIYARLESLANNTICTSLSYPDAYIVYSVHQERSGVVCTKPENNPIAVSEIFFSKQFIN